MNDEHLDPRQVEDRYAPILSRAKLERLRREGGEGLPFVRLRGRCFYRVADIERFIAMHREGGARSQRDEQAGAPRGEESLGER